AANTAGNIPAPPLISTLQISCLSCANSKELRLLTLISGSRDGGFSEQETYPDRQCDGSDVDSGFQSVRTDCAANWYGSCAGCGKCAKNRLRKHECARLAGSVLCQLKPPSREPE